MKTRIISGLAMVPLLIFVYLGGYFLAAICLVASIFAVREFFLAFENASEASEITGPVKPSLAITIVSAVMLYGLVIFVDKTFVFLWIGLVTIISFTMLFKLGKHSITDVLITVIANIYIVFFFFHIVMISIELTPLFNDSNTLIQGLRSPIWFVILSAFGSDIFAYFVGVTLGKHKLCPNLSPKKTIEGLIGGIIGSTLLCGLFAYFALPDLFIHGLIIGALGAGVATMGDLTASAIKRRLGIKDYGNIIPGHGGILDRFDSVLFTGPFVYYYFHFILFISTTFEWIP